jgi:hypothetical protein
MFNRKWGIMAKVPYVMRSVKSAGEHDEDHEEDAAITTTNRNSLGDVKINGIYSGFFSDMSTGITFGLKLPTGANKQSGFDKDTQIGTGSVDAILGAYHLGRFNFDGSFGWFTQANWQKPIITKSDFHPGDEISGSIGSYYSLGKVGSLSKVSPMLQIIATKKTRDSGVASDNANSGYSRAFIAPGVEINIAQFKIYSDIELPIYEQVNGYQLAVGKVLKVIVGYRF